jgi:hypothetical protein
MAMNSIDELSMDIPENYPRKHARLFEEKTPENGVIRLEKWPEGYELWYHGRRVWKSDNA